MTEEIKYNKDEKWIPYKQLAETPQQTIDRLEQENKELKSDVLKWQKAFSRQYQINENKGYSKAEENYRSALEEIREIVKDLKQTKIPFCEIEEKIQTKINEVLNDKNNS